MALKKRQILTGDKYAGVDATYDPNHRLLTLSGWYDTYVGIAPEAMTLTKFLFHLGITEAHVRKALDTVAWARCANCEDSAWTYFDGEAGVCVDEKACTERCDKRRRDHEDCVLNANDVDADDDEEEW